VFGEPIWQCDGEGVAGSDKVAVGEVELVQARLEGGSAQSEAAWQQSTEFELGSRAAAREGSGR
jgi:hypothetical protein